jgi:hypothetical protein
LPPGRRWNCHPAFRERVVRGPYRDASARQFVGVKRHHRRPARGDVIDFADISAGAGATIQYSGSNLPGTLTVSDGTHTATINLIGNFSLGNFVAASDGHSGTTMVDPPLTTPAASTGANGASAALAAVLLNQYMAAFAPIAADSALSTAPSGEGSGQPALPLATAALPSHSQ